MTASTHFMLWLKALEQQATPCPCETLAGQGACPQRMRGPSLHAASHAWNGLALAQLLLALVPLGRLASLTLLLLLTSHGSARKVHTNAMQSCSHNQGLLVLVQVAGMLELLKALRAHLFLQVACCAYPGLVTCATAQTSALIWFCPFCELPWSSNMRKGPNARFLPAFIRLLRTG